MSANLSWYSWEETEDETWNASASKNLAMTRSFLKLTTIKIFSKQLLNGSMDLEKEWDLDGEMELKI